MRRLQGREPVDERVPRRRQESVEESRPGSQLEAAEYRFVIVAGAVAFGLVLLARARHRDRHERDQLRAHVRGLSGPSDSGM